MAADTLIAAQVATSRARIDNFVSFVLVVAVSPRHDDRKRPFRLRRVNAADWRSMHSAAAQLQLIDTLHCSC